MEEDGAEAKELTWNREIVPTVLKIVSSRLPQRDLISLLLVSPYIYRNLVSYPSLWLALDFREMTNAGNRLVDALSLPRYKDLKQINLEFAQGIEDKHFELLRNKADFKKVEISMAICSAHFGVTWRLHAHGSGEVKWQSLQNLESLNLNMCQKISDKGIEAITSLCPKLKVFSIYWNVRVTDLGIKHLMENCRYIVDLNLSGCKNILDKSLELIADNYRGLESLNLTRCVKLTDGGLQQILRNCWSLQDLNLYALSVFTDNAYKKISQLACLKSLDLCGAQNLSDEGLICISKCKNLISLNLTWCVRVTDEGVTAIAEGCTSLEFLSLFGIVKVTDKSLEALSKTCSNTLTTLDVNGCIGIKRRTREELLLLFPYLKCFKVHS